METIKLYDLKINHNNHYNFNIIYEELVRFVNSSPISSGTFLLDYTNIKSKDDINFIEKFVYDTAIFHLNEYNIANNTNINIQDIFIEFWGLNDTHFKRMHFDKDEQEYNIDNNISSYGQPFLSCITYLNDDNYTAPTIITDIVRIKNSPCEREDYYNEKNCNFGFVFPKKMKQMTFNGGKYLHGMTLFNDKCQYRLVLPMNFWFKKPKYLSYFPYHSYIRRNYSQQQIYNIYKINKFITQKSLFNYNNIEADIKNVNINISQEKLQDFIAWYKNLIFGEEPTNFSMLEKYINKKYYLYTFKFSCH
jgi:hypothetical protein